ncbi:MAG: acyl-CoA thioesterase [Chloroflexota bacterium]|nr:acyl-CoA thioesterase [Chloroflexota bacterium]
MTGVTVTEIRVRYAETDAMGVVYYANYLVWFELARTDWIRAHGMSYREMEDAGILLPVIEAHCEYRASARYDDLVRLETRVTALSPARVSFAYRVTRPAPAADGVGETLLAEGRTAHVFLTREGRIARLNRHPRLWAALSGAFASGQTAAGGEG